MGPLGLQLATNASESRAFIHDRREDARLDDGMWSGNSKRYWAPAELPSICPQYLRDDPARSGRQSARRHRHSDTRGFADSEHI